MKYPLILMSALALAACQGSEVPQASSQAPSMPAQHEQPVKQAHSEAASQRPMADADKAMAVKKPEPENTARGMQQMAESSGRPASRASLKQALEQPAKPEVQKPAATVPEAAPAPEAAPVERPVEKAPAGDVAHGKTLARKCQACHNFNDRRKVGPGLAGIFGRKAGTMRDMRYSDALARGGWSWDEAHLAAWLCDSRAAVKTFSGDAAAKTKMPAQRICDAKDQADLIAFLKTL